MQRKFACASENAEVATFHMKYWLLAARPKTLLASMAPVAIGTAIAYRDGVMHLASALAALLGAVSIQIGTNFCNDYFDFFQGADTADRKGPTRAVQAGLISARAMLAATILVFSVAALVCVYLAWRAGWPLVVIGALSILLGVLYTAGRRSLAYMGLGDPFVLAFFGPVAVGGTYYVQARTLPLWLLVAGLAPGLLSVGLLVVNNLRDVEEDRLANKRTPVVRFGTSAARWQYTVCIALASSIPVWLWSQGSLPSPCLLASAIIFPGALVIRQVWICDGVLLNPCLAKTAGLLLMYSVLFCVGCVVG